MLQLALLIALVVGAIAGGAWLISYVRRQMIAEAEDQGVLSQFQEAYDVGQIDADEYRRIREALDRQAAGREIGGPSRPLADRPPRAVATGPEAVPPPDPGPQPPPLRDQEPSPSAPGIDGR